ncbi:hypothetical protein [Methylobacter luteus]|uniref:hypothetical protein n=1 Tax=Methylobacter luteus TaxID=415 RepID=UPI00048355BB|nr:hypothetical protein [Methylobacter luteus]
MKILSGCTQKTRVVLSAIAFSTLSLAGESALAQATEAVITNGVTNPVQIRDTAGIGVNPYQNQASISDSSTCAPQCRLTFPAVPANQRLVVTYVSAQLDATSSAVLEGGAETLFLIKTGTTGTNISLPVTFYYEPGDTPVIRVFQQNSTARTSLIGLLVGHLVPIQGTQPAQTEPAQ